MTVYVLTIHSGYNSSRVDSVWENMVDLCEHVAKDIIGYYDEEDLKDFFQDTCEVDTSKLVKEFLECPDMMEEFGYQVDDVNLEKNRARK